MQGLECVRKGGLACVERWKLRIRPSYRTSETVHRQYGPRHAPTSHAESVNTLSNYIDEAEEADIEGDGDGGGECTPHAECLRYRRVICGTGKDTIASGGVAK